MCHAAGFNGFAGTVSFAMIRGRLTFSASQNGRDTWKNTVLLPPAQETLDTLRQAMKNTGIMCAVMLDTKVREEAPGRSVVP